MNISLTDVNKWRLTKKSSTEMEKKMNKNDFEFIVKICKIAKIDNIEGEFKIFEHFNTMTDAVKFAETNMENAFQIWIIIVDDQWGEREYRELYVYDKNKMDENYIVSTIPKDSPLRKIPMK